MVLNVKAGKEDGKGFEGNFCGAGNVLFLHWVWLFCVNPLSYIPMKTKTFTLFMFTTYIIFLYCQWKIMATILKIANISEHV